jgi:hypothetical protein
LIAEKQAMLGVIPKKAAKNITSENMNQAMPYT